MQQFGTTAFAKRTQSTLALLAAALALGACDKPPQAQTTMDPRVAKALEDFKNRRIYGQLTPSVLSTITDKRFYDIDEDLSAPRIAKIRSSPTLFSGD